MSKKVLIIETSLRPNSNSDKLAESFAEGARAAGNEVEVVSLKGKNIKFCTGCFGCLKIGHCVMKDDANEITEKILEAEFCLIHDYFLAIMCCSIANFANQIQTFPQGIIYQVMKIFGTHQTKQRILIRQLQGLVHGIHPLNSKFHSTTAVDYTGFQINVKNLLCSNSNIRKTIKFWFLL